MSSSWVELQKRRWLSGTVNARPAVRDQLGEYPTWSSRRRFLPSRRIANRRVAADAPAANATRLPSGANVGVCGLGTDELDPITVRRSRPASVIVATAVALRSGAQARTA